MLTKLALLEMARAAEGGAGTTATAAAAGSTGRSAAAAGSAGLRGDRRGGESDGGEKEAAAYAAYKCALAPPGGAWWSYSCSIQPAHLDESIPTPPLAYLPSTRPHHCFCRFAFRQSALRWHPDKFEARFRGRLRAAAPPASGAATGGGAAAAEQALPQDSWEAIIARVQGIAQAINEQWDKLREGGRP